jgi:protein TonB
VRLKRESTVEQKKRELPSQAKADEPPPPDMDVAAPEAPSDLPTSGALASTFEPMLDLGGGPALGAAPSDADVVPLVRVSPQYPPDAMMRGVEGWVQLEFTITTAGTVKDVRVVEADPKGYFEKAAISAVKRYKYKPKIENGEPVDRAGVQLVLSFKLAR